MTAAASVLIRPRIREDLPAAAASRGWHVFERWLDAVMTEQRLGLGDTTARTDPSA